VRRTITLLLAVALAAPACRPQADRSRPTTTDTPAVADDAPDPGGETPEGPAPAAPALSFARIAVLGASVSAGFGTLTDVAAVLDAAVRVPHQVRDLASTSLFRDPFAGGQQQVDSALEFRPTVVFAIDFLFWYAYGYGWTTDERLRNADRGLQQLERFEVPVLIGEVPDMTGAAHWMLSPEQIPAPPTLALLNERIRRWAADRQHVLLLPLPQWTAPLRATTPVTLDETGRTVEPRRLMNLDGLHPNAAGLRYLLRKVRERILDRYPGTPAHTLAIPAPFDGDPDDAHVLASPP
jgi:hypothetical protein